MPIQHERNKSLATCEARELTATQPTVIDTQTTGDDDYAESCEMGMFRYDSYDLVNSTIRSVYGTPKQEDAWHGNTDDDVKHAPSLRQATFTRRSWINARSEYRRCAARTTNDASSRRTWKSC